jgi:thiamine pyrophosphokinase
MRAVVFANGDFADEETARSRLQEGDLVIAADGGVRHALSLGLVPALLVGDLDSAPRELVQIAERRGAEVIRHPRRKDKTDLELALDLSRERGAEEVLIFGALGGRLDHALANILALAPATTSGTAITIVDAGYELTIVSDSVCVKGQGGDTVTLLAITDEVNGVTTESLEYEVHDATFRRGSSLGVSNVMVGETAQVSVTEGLLLLVHVSQLDGDEAVDGEQH